MKIASGRSCSLFIWTNHISERDKLPNIEFAHKQVIFKLVEILVLLSSIPCFPPQSTSLEMNEILRCSYIYVYDILSSIQIDSKRHQVILRSPSNLKAFSILNTAIL
jgi:hypothetical protein